LAPNPPPIPNALAGNSREIAEVDLLEDLQQDSNHIERLTANPNVSERDRRFARFEHKLGHLSQKLTSFIGRQQEIAEMEIWNADAGSALMAATERFGRIPFPLQEEIFDMDTAEPKRSDKGKEKESASSSSAASSSKKPDVPIFIRDPVKFQQEWWYHTMPHLLDVKDDKYQKPISSISYVGPYEHRLEVYVDPIRREHFDVGYECPCGEVFEALFKSHIQECGTNILISLSKIYYQFHLY